MLQVLEDYEDIEELKKILPQKMNKLEILKTMREKMEVIY